MSEMAERVPPAPTVYCPKDRQKVPIWHCLGSLTQGRAICPYLVRARVHGGERAEVECKWNPEPPLYRRGRRRITELAQRVDQKIEADKEAYKMMASVYHPPLGELTKY